jgi:signal transduction histidine kinase
VVNDGVVESAVPNGQHRGLENLTTRLEAIGGRISLDVHDGQFELLAEAPNPEVAGLGASDVPFTA